MYHVNDTSPVFVHKELPVFPRIIPFLEHQPCTPPHTTSPIQYISIGPSTLLTRLRPPEVCIPQMKTHHPQRKTQTPSQASDRFIHVSYQRKGRERVRGTEVTPFPNILRFLQSYPERLRGRPGSNSKPQKKNSVNKKGMERWRFDGGKVGRYCFISQPCTPSPRQTLPQTTIFICPTHETQT